MEKLYLISISESSCVPENICLHYFPERYERSKRFYHKDDQLRSIGAGVLLNYYCNIREDKIQIGEFGKLFSPDFSGYFNLSHSGSYTCLAMDDNEIGVDIEKIKASHLKIAGRIFLEEERLWMEKEPEKRFFTLWTLKESVMKYFGTGLKMTPSSFSVLSAIHGDPIFLNGKQLYCKSFEIEGHMLSLCCEHPVNVVHPEIISLNQLKM